MKRMAEQIKSNLRTKSVMEHYGIQFNRRGFAKCPFHKEKTASLSVKNDYFKCFGCGQGGGVIDFVMEYHGLNFSQAIIKLNNDFNLGLTGKKPTFRQQRKTAELLKKRREEKEKHMQSRKDYLEQVNVYQYLQKAITKHAPTDMDSCNWHPVFIYAAQHLNEMEYWLDENVDRLEGNR